MIITTSTKPRVVDAERSEFGFTYNLAGGYGVLLATCNCCGGLLHVNVTRHGYVTLDCEDFGDKNSKPCRHARNASHDGWNWKCYCPKDKLDRVCPNRDEKSVEARKKIQNSIETVIYIAAMSRKFVCMDLRETDYVDFEPAIIDAANMAFEIDGKPNQRPYFVLVRRYYKNGENISSRFYFLKKNVARVVILKYASMVLSFLSRMAKRFKNLDWIMDRYEIL